MFEKQLTCISFACHVLFDFSKGSINDGLCPFLASQGWGWWERLSLSSLAFADATFLPILCWNLCMTKNSLLRLAISVPRCYQLCRVAMTSIQHTSDKLPVQDR